MENAVSVGAMNEIDPKFIKIQQTPVRDSKTNPAKSDPFKKEAFGKVLSDHFEKDIKASGSKGIFALPELEGSFRAAAHNFKLDRKQFTQKLEASLSQLESYAAWLDDPKKSLKQTHGLLKQMLGQTKLLEREFKSNETSHPDLAQILSQLKTTLQVEQIKFNRGDYLN